MGRYNRSHRTSREWLIERPFNDALGVRNRDVHKSSITDRHTGRKGSGTGSTRNEADRKAWRDLKR